MRWRRNSSTARFDPADIEDRYEARLRPVNEAKLAGECLKAAPKPKSAGTVIDLMAALKKRLGRSGSSK